MTDYYPFLPKLTWLIVIVNTLRLKDRFLESSMKVAIAFSLFLPALSNACMCAAEPKDLTAIYREAEGIYLVVLNDISVVSNLDGKVELGLGLSVLKRFKGAEIDGLEAVGYSSVPTLNREGGISRETTSCDMSYVFGDQYIVVVNADEKVVIGRCSNSLLSIDLWGDLVDLAR